MYALFLMEMLFQSSKVRFLKAQGFPRVRNPGDLVGDRDVVEAISSTRNFRRGISLISDADVKLFPAVSKVACLPCSFSFLMLT